MVVEEWREDMGRMHSHSRGKAHSTRPTFKRAPSWITYSPDEVVSLIVKMAKDDVPPSLIGVKLRDDYGIPLVKPILGKSIGDVLKENNFARELPEDLDKLVKKAKMIQVHLKRYPSDRKNVRSLELAESKIHRLSKHYKKIGLLPAIWKYKTQIVQAA